MADIPKDVHVDIIIMLMVIVFIVIKKKVKQKEIVIMLGGYNVNSHFVQYFIISV